MSVERIQCSEYGCEATAHEHGNLCAEHLIAKQREWLADARRRIGEGNDRAHRLESRIAELEAFVREVADWQHDYDGRGSMAVHLKDCRRCAAEKLIGRAGE